MTDQTAETNDDVREGTDSAEEELLPTQKGSGSQYSSPASFEESQGSSSVPPATSDVLPVTSDVPPSTSGVHGIPSGVPGGASDVPQVPSVVSAVLQPCPDAKDLDEKSEKPAKRRHENSGSSETSEPFRITTSVSSRGRPKVRKQQQQTTKKQRIGEGRKTANKLVQGKLAPVQSLGSVMVKFGEMDIYEEAKGVLAVITERSLPKTKKAIAGKFNEGDCEADIRYVFSKVFVKKALSVIRVFLKSLGDEVSGDVVVKVPRFGIYSDKDIHAMDRWHTAMEYVADTKQAIDWVQNTIIKRIGIPMELQDGVSDIPADRKAMIKRIPLRRSRSTPFGGLPYRELLSFCDNKWVNDGAMSHGITLLQREHDGVGIVNPLFHRLSDRAARVTAVNVGNPFQEGHHLILVPLHLEDSHWCGAVIDLRSDSRGITIFDPLQDKKDKYYAVCKTTLKDIYGELYEILHVKLETKCRQPDASSCGVAVLMFFECILCGVVLPTTPSQSFMRFMRLRYLLKCIS